MKLYLGSIKLIQKAINTIYQEGEVVIVGRGGQAILKNKPGVLHVRIEAPLKKRVKYVQKKEQLSHIVAQELVTERDRAAAAYLKRFYNIDWTDSLFYHLVINTAHWKIGTAANLIADAVKYI